MVAVSIPAGFHSLPLPLVQVSLAAVLKCGQSFRWTSYSLTTSTAHDHSDPSACPTHEYRFCLRDRVVCLRQSPEVLFYRSVFPDEHVSPTQTAIREAETLTWLKDYFQLNIDLVKLYDEWSERDAVFYNLRCRFSGIRMLRQDPWENLVSFICSSNNNIARITKMVHSLCKNYSPPLLSLTHPSPASDGTLEVVAYHPFPPPSVLATPKIALELRSLGFGYRADFIQRTAKMLVDEHVSTPIISCGREGPEKWLVSLRDLETSKAREELLRFVGVGRKVADCILLMSLDKKEVIPVDTHVHQIAMKHYGFHTPGGSKGKVAMTPKLYDEINSKLADIWGDYAGWAHSVLFTADLKVFSLYGMPMSPPASIEATPPSAPLPATPSDTPSRGSRTRAKVPLDVEALPHHLEVGSTSLAERVKKRRRTNV
ncbi:DNA glycosylase [Paxillus ammoniavirescens]|nr:DNA glycosylase [Paxillus ammoniavirescens]